MNILFVATDYVKSGKPTSGFPAYLYRVSQALIAMGHRPIILVIGKEEYHYFDGGLEIYSTYVPGVKCGNKYFNYIFDVLRCSWTANKKIKVLVGDKNIDIIQFTSLKALALLYYGRVPAVVRLSSYARIYYQTYASIDRKQTEVMAFLERMSTRRCRAVYAPCRATAVKFGADARRKVFVLETPFLNDVVEYDYYYADKLAGKKYLLFFGILTVEKGILVIAEILEKFLDKYKDYYFVFIGKPYLISGINAAKLLKDAAGKHKDRVLLYGELPHEQLYPVIMRAKFVVLPYLNDNLPNACLEAMSFGKVVIGIDGGSFEQVIENRQNGILCKPNDAEDLLDKIDYVMAMDENEKKRVGEKAKKRIQMLRPEISVKKLICFYEAVISQDKK